MNDQMIRVISSPSRSTTGFFTLILAMCRSLGDWRAGRYACDRAADAIDRELTGSRGPRGQEHASRWLGACGVGVSLACAMVVTGAPSIRPAPAQPVLPA